MLRLTHTRALVLLAGLAALAIPACTPAGGSTNALDLGGTCTPGAAAEIQVLPSGNTGTLRIQTLPGGGLDITCLPGSTTTGSTTTSSTTVPDTTTSSTEATTTTTTTTLPPSTTSTTEPTTTTSTPPSSTSTLGV